MLTPNASCTLYLQTGRGLYKRIFCPAVFWQESEDGNVTVILPEDLPEQYKGPGRERDYVVWGERSEEANDTETLRPLIAAGALTVEAIARCMFGGLPHCEVTAK